MSKHLVLVVLVCLAVLVDGSKWFSFKKSPSKRVDMDGLNKYLIGKLSDDQDAESNLQFLGRNINNLKGGTRRAAELLMKLPEVNICDENVLFNLHELQDAGLRASNVKRIDRVILPHLSRVLILCTSYIDQSVAQRFNNEWSSRDQTLVEFAKVVRPPYSSDGDVGEYHFNSLLDNKQPDILDMYLLIHFLNHMTRDDPPARQFKIVVDDEVAGERRIVKQAANFECSFRLYLVQPCQRWQATFGNLFEGAKTVGMIQNRLYSYVKSRTVEFRRLAWTNRACEFILNMSPGQKRLMFLEL